jgi:hypothetical protein
MVVRGSFLKVQSDTAQVIHLLVALLLHFHLSLSLSLLYHSRPYILEFQFRIVNCNTVPAIVTVCSSHVAWDAFSFHGAVSLTRTMEEVVHLA